MSRIFKKFFVVFFWALIFSLFFDNVFAQSQTHSGSNGYDAAYRSPLDLVSEITDSIDETFIQGQPDSEIKGNDYDPTRHSPLDLVSKIASEVTEVDIVLEKGSSSGKFEAEIPIGGGHESALSVAQTFDISSATSGFEDAEDPFADEHPEYPQISDPFEGYNRFMHSVNDGLFEYLIEPVARNYAEFVHDDIRLAIRNVFSNVGAPLRLVSSILQGDVDKTVRVFGRFILNSTIGIGGLFDVAGNYYEVESVNEDFEQALGFYGVGSGPYLVLPFLGPSSARNVVGKVVDSFLSPMIMLAPGFEAGVAMNATETINSLSFNYKGYNALKQDSVDPYISMRDFQHQYREKLIHE